MADPIVAAETCVALGATEHQSAIWLSSFCLSCEGCRDGSSSRIAVSLRPESSHRQIDLFDQIRIRRGGLTRIDADVDAVMVCTLRMCHQPRYQEENHRDSDDHGHHELPRRMVAPPDAPNAFR